MHSAGVANGDGRDGAAGRAEADAATGRLRRLDRKHPFRLLIVSGRALLREGLAELFEGRGNVCVTTCDRVQRARKRRARSPEVVLIDVAHSTVGLEETVLQARARRPRVKPVVLEERFLPARLRDAVEAGVWGYWTLADPFEHLADAMERIAAGAKVFSPAADPYIVRDGRNVRYAPPAEGSALSKITEREMDVLRLLAQGLGVKECAERLGVAPCTVENHKARLMKRLKVHRVTELIRFAFREGLAVP